MACTTILVGKKASYDGSTMVARNDDTGAGRFTVKKMAMIDPKDISTNYKSVLSHVEITLPANPMRISAVPDVLHNQGIWCASGINEANVGMTATETITTNPRVLGADPLVEYQPAEGDKPEVPGGIGEEDIVYLVLPYIHSAREGVERLGKLLETYGTYESNGIAFHDADEIWWLETIGGHHWMARRVPDDEYVVMANQLGINHFNFEDAYSSKEDYMCSPDLKDFVKENYLATDQNGKHFDPRAAFGSHDDSDFVYNTPRVWYMLRYFNPHTKKWDGPDADYTPASGNLPWSMVPEKKITPEDVKYILSSNYQNTPYNPYAINGDEKLMGLYRPIGINRTAVTVLTQIRPYGDSLGWVAFASNFFNVMIPQYSKVTKVPAYLENVTGDVSTDCFYWSSRMLAAMADASYYNSHVSIEDYQFAVQSKNNELVKKYDALLAQETDEAKKVIIREQANQEVADMAQKMTTTVLGKVLFNLSNKMKNAYSLSDA